MTDPKPLYFITAIAAFICIAVVAVVFNKCDERHYNPQTSNTTAAQVEKTKAIEFKHQPLIDSLFTANGELTVKDSLNKKTLTFLQSENKRLARLAEAHIDSMGLFVPPDENENDYTSNNRELILAAAASDSACNETISNLDSISLNKSKIIAQKDSLLKGFKESFSASIEAQNKQNKYIYTLQKKAKNRQKVNLVLGAIVILGTGLFLVK